MIAQYLKELATTPPEVLRQHAIEVSEAYKKKTKGFKYKHVQVNTKTVVLKRIK